MTHGFSIAAVELSAALLVAYAIGCFNTSYYLVRWRLNRDLRTLGSGNAGATNAGRALGPIGFGVALVGDMGKGALAVFGAQCAGLSDFVQAVVGLAVVAGHNWPLQLGLRGGKGIATGFGALMLFNPFLTLGLLGGCSAVLAVTRLPTLSAMLAFGLFPIATLLLGHTAAAALGFGALFPALIYPHRETLRLEVLSLGKKCRRRRDTVSGSAHPTQFRFASKPWEFAAIHRLNYRTFVEEIPQHPPNARRSLVDRYHLENTYVIAVRDDRLIAMLALRAQRPFSLDQKVNGLDDYLPAGRAIEARLLAVEPKHRHSVVFTGLFRFAARSCRARGFDLAVISAATRQLNLYRHLGFIAFGPLTGKAPAQFQPMYLTLEAFGRFAKTSHAFRDLSDSPPAVSPPLNLLPGPVMTRPDVDAAFASLPISHRSPAFLSQITHVRRRLCALVDARDVQILPGSGSLANTVIAAQLGLRPARGLVISNGEFGERLAQEARRGRLDFDWLQLPWGAPFDLDQIEHATTRLGADGWIWFTHHETSTGMLNPLDALKLLAVRRNCRLCVDCVSSLGATPTDLRGVHLAAGSSGKALAAYPGLAFVFHNYVPRPEPDRLPGYLDLGHWASHASVPYTHSSNLVAALAVALNAITPARFTRLREHTAWLRSRLRQTGCALVTAERDVCPGLITIAMPARASENIGSALERERFTVHYRSAHLQPRDWLQVSLFGDPTLKQLQAFVDALTPLLGHRLPTALQRPVGQPIAA